ncbi:MAG: outer membrane lipoprotein carrier protein LolA [Geobacteraceae bacterium]|nr:outer membrane lipoprotein carrier protein LolA [Geobacteraceae bacterium]
MTRLISGAVLILILLASSAFAEEPVDLARILSTVNSGYASIEDLHAEFSQRTYVASLKREEKGSGELFLKKKGGTAQFRFNYTRPKQNIISNGKNVWYYLPENKQVIITDTAKLFSGGNGMALSYLTGLGSIAKDFDIRLLAETPDKKGNYQLELIPKKQNPAVSKLHLFVSSDAVNKAQGSTGAFFPIASSVIFDQMGNRTTIEYSRIRINSGVASDKFNFTPPAGVDVIKQ